MVGFEGVECVSCGVGVELVVVDGVVIVCFLESGCDCLIFMFVEKFDYFYEVEEIVVLYVLYWEEIICKSCVYVDWNCILNLL